MRLTAAKDHHDKRDGRTKLTQGQAQQGWFDQANLDDGQVGLS
jgi:hypothetical protein